MFACFNQIFDPDDFWGWKVFSVFTNILYELHNRKAKDWPDQEANVIFHSLFSLGFFLESWACTVSDTHVVDEGIVEINDNDRPKYSFTPAFTAGVANAEQKKAKAISDRSKINGTN